MIYYVLADLETNFSALTKKYNYFILNFIFSKTDKQNRNYIIGLGLNLKLESYKYNISPP